jgi:hypothetical protein
MLMYLVDYLLSEVKKCWVMTTAGTPPLSCKSRPVKSTAYVDPSSGSVTGWLRVHLRTRQRLVRPKPFL